MKAVVNDLAFAFPFDEETQALEAIKKFIYVCKELESARCHHVNQVLRADLDKSTELAPGCSIYKIVQKISDRNERTYLLSLLTSRKKPDFSGQPFIYKGKKSYLCAWAKDELLISMESEGGLANKECKGTIKGKEICIKNISSEKHMYFYRELLGIRLYEANAKKHKKDRENYYGKGKVASPMDLTDQEAQELLNRAILIKNRLYARKGTRNYAFQLTGDCTYHGYIADDLREDILTVLYKEKWD